MTADTGYIKVWFDGSDEVLASLRKLVDNTNRQNLFSCGLSWLDELDGAFEAESEAISYDSISSTQEFLTLVLAQFPDLRFEGTLEHCWPTIPCKRTTVTFESSEGQLIWQEQIEEDVDEFHEEGFFDAFEPDEDEIFIPLTPYDE